LVFKNAENLFFQFADKMVFFWKHIILKANLNQTHNIKIWWECFRNILRVLQKYFNIPPQILWDKVSLNLEIRSLSRSGGWDFVKVLANWSLEETEYHAEDDAWRNDNQSRYVSYVHRIHHYEQSVWHFDCHNKWEN